MKNTPLFALLLLAAAAIHLVACNKDEATKIQYQLDQIQLVANPQSTQDLLQLAQDADDEKITRFCYEMGLATRDLIKDLEFNQTMIDLAKKNPVSVVYLLDLKQDAPAYYQQINENLAKKNLSLEYIAANMTHAPALPNPEHPETAQIEHYEPALFIPNLAYVDANKQPLLSPSLVVDGDKNPELEDYAVTWFFTEAGELKETLLSEAMSLKTTNPIFVMDNAQRFAQGAVVLGNNRPMDALIPENTANDRVIIRFDSRELKINSGYSYEASAASEYAIVGYRIQANPSTTGTAHWVYNSSGWKVITDIPANQIGQTVTVPSLHANVWLPYADNRFFWNTFERDWINSEKSLGQATFDGLTIYLVGRRKFDSEWYAWIPSTLQDHATPFEWYGWETSVNFASWKADYVVHKVEQ